MDGVVGVEVVVLLKMARFSAKERQEALSGLCVPSPRLLGRDLYMIR